MDSVAIFFYLYRFNKFKTYSLVHRKSKKGHNTNRRCVVNKLVVNGSRQAIENLKYEIANELGVKLGADTSSRLNGSVGGEMTRRLVKLGEQYYSSKMSK